MSTNRAIRQFEYKLVCAAELAGAPVEGQLNKLGKHGWALVTIQDLKGTTYYIFMREITTPQIQQATDL